MRSLLSRFSDWVVSHPVLWGVGVGVVLVLLGFAFNLAPSVVIAAGAAIGVLNIVHAKRRGYCPLPAESGSMPTRAEDGVRVESPASGFADSSVAQEPSTALIRLSTACRMH
jgi:hypothetical protein